MSQENFFAPLKDKWFLLLAVCLCLAVRIFFHFLSPSVDSDEAIVGLMGKHIASGNASPVFYYGQPYMGALEAYHYAFYLKLFPFVPHELLLRLVPITWSLLLIPVVYLLGFYSASTDINRGIDFRKQIARFAALFTAVANSNFIIWTAKARGGFVEVIVLSCLALAMLAAWRKSNNPTLISGMGLVLGIGWWVNNQIIYAIATCGLVISYDLVAKNSPTIKAPFNLGKVFTSTLMRGLVPFFIGSSPFWYYNLTNNFASFGLFNLSDQIGENLTNFARHSLAMLLGVRAFWREVPDSPLFEMASLLIFAYVVILAIFKRIFLFNFLWISLLVFVVSSFGSLTLEPRYLLPVIPVFAVIQGIVFWELLPSRTLRCLALAIPLIYLVNPNYYTLGQPFAWGQERVSKDHRELIAWLKQNNITEVRTNYWIGYRLAFETNEKVTFRGIGLPFKPRIPVYEEQKRLPQPPLVVTPKSSHHYENGLRALNFQFMTSELSGYHVIHQIVQTPVKSVPISHQVASTHQGNLLPMLADGDVKTRWGSGAPQSKNMIVTLNGEFADPLLKMNFHGFLTDMPQGLQIYCSRKIRSIEKLSEILGLEKERRERLLGKKVLNYKKYLDAKLIIDEFHLEEMTLRLKCQGKQLILRQVGNHPIFDWSITELTAENVVPEPKLEPMISQTVLPLVTKPLPHTQQQGYIPPPFRNLLPPQGFPLPKPQENGTQTDNVLPAEPLQ